MTVRAYKPRNFENVFEEETFKTLKSALSDSPEDYVLFGPVRIDRRELDGLIISDGFMVALEAKAVKGHVSMGANTPVTVTTDEGETVDFQKRYEDPYDQAEKHWKELASFIRNAFGETGMWIVSMLVFEPGSSFDVPAQARDIHSGNSLIVALDEMPAFIARLAERYNHNALSSAQQEVLIKAVTQGPARLNGAEKGLFAASVAPAMATRPSDPPSTPLPRKPSRAVDQTQFLPGVGPSLPSLRKSWYRSPWFMWISFFLLNPLWAFLMLTDRRQRFFVKLIAIFFLLGEMLTCLGGLYLVQRNPGIIGVLRPVPILSHTPAPVATAGQSTPAPTIVPSLQAEPTTGEPGACVIAWVETDGEEIANKNRAIVWEEIVRAMVAGSDMTEKQFYAEVLERNPGLQADGYVFLVGETYLLPACEY